MKRARQKIKTQNRKRVRLRSGSLFVLCITLAVAGSSGWQLLKLRSQVEGQLANLSQEKVTLLQQEKLLHDEITQLNTPSYIEQLAREQLGLVKHGEILISPKN
ncbi:FtsB family cell division protein [Desulfosporosinus metallidurans]|uniref:Cell division protein DivIC (FtsB), stabilizes FtsL against RasP cleavage n=1 Tax=Desulfosporosinus metallidurans TaxID=1888891 RepID=A0A1Q8QLF3_9FIRM|nr:septum formation initiator family protein [Desulfosporosinus metallidurans]OLN28169.1 Cell division protein DivIC (FtsB), stabilizes FtsL against RasP cleavage [Desulfosporosinus metallidurans]